MRVLFLDIDGVLNSQRFFDGRKWDEHVEQLIKVAEPPNIIFWVNMIDPVALRLLEDLMSSIAGLRIVISSSWREVHPLVRLIEIFREAGFVWSHNIIDRIDIGQRTIEIPAWIMRFEQEITAWAVLDDLKLENLEARHVRTTWQDGLKKEHIDAVLKLLR